MMAAWDVVWMNYIGQAWRKFLHEWQVMLWGFMGSNTNLFIWTAVPFACMGNMKKTKGGNVLWLTRVPETLFETQRLVRETAQESMEELKTGYFGKNVSLSYAEIEQRWLIVYSQTAYQRELQSLEKAQARERTQAEKQ